jgi:DNA-binding transcriptional MerR regulator
MTDSPLHLSLTELADKSGFTARTIRLYISKKLLPPPLKAGREAAYGQVHLDVLHSVKGLKDFGLTLEQIRNQLQEQGVIDPTLPVPVPWLIIQPADDVAVMVRSDVAPWRRNLIDRALVDFVRAVTPKNLGDEPTGE